MNSHLCDTLLLATLQMRADRLVQRITEGEATIVLGKYQSVNEINVEWLPSRKSPRFIFFPSASHDEITSDGREAADDEGPTRARGFSLLSSQPFTFSPFSHLPLII